MSKDSSAKFKADLYKHFGYVLCTPLCGVIFNALVFNTPSDGTMTSRVLICAAFTAIGLASIIKALEIMEELNANTNRLSK
jgi:hypothetical protein